MKKMILILCSFPLYLSASGGANSQYFDAIPRDEIRQFVHRNWNCLDNANIPLHRLYNKAASLTPQDIINTAVTLNCDLSMLYEKNSGDTLLHEIALRGGDPETAAYLILEMGLDATQRNTNGLTAIQIAESNGYHVLAKRLRGLAEALNVPVTNNPQPNQDLNKQKDDPDQLDKPSFLREYLTLRNGLVGTAITLSALYLWRRYTKKDIAEQA